MALYLAGNHHAKTPTYMSMKFFSSYSSRCVATAGKDHYASLTFQTARMIILVFRLQSYTRYTI